MTYPVILNGDHADFEREHANALPQDRPDWPLPSFDARDWATAFCKHNPRLMKDRDEWRDKALKSSPAEPRPANCRNRRRDEGKPYPKSGCHACGTGGMTGCPHERGALPADADRLRLADIKTDQLETVDSILTTLDRYTDSIQGKNDLKCGILMANYAMLEAAKIIRLLVSLRAGGWREDMVAFGMRAYALCEPDGKHWRVVVGFQSLSDAQSALTAVANFPSAPHTDKND